MITVQVVYFQRHLESPRCSLKMKPIFLRTHETELLQPLPYTIIHERKLTDGFVLPSILDLYSLFLHLFCHQLCPFLLSSFLPLIKNNHRFSFLHLTLWKLGLSHLRYVSCIHPWRLIEMLRRITE